MRSLSQDGTLNSLPPATIEMTAAQWNDIRQSSGLSSIATAAIETTSDECRKHLSSFAQNQHLQLYEDIMELAKTKARGIMELK